LSSFGVSQPQSFKSGDGLGSFIIDGMNTTQSLKSILLSLVICTVSTVVAVVTPKLKSPTS
jgi:hypothetical protein